MNPTRRFHGARRLRHILPAAAACLGLLGPAAVRADAAVAADGWDTALQHGCRPARLKPLALEQGCGPSGCGSWAGPLFVDADGAGLRRRSGLALALVTAPWPAADLPDLNWTPLQAFSVHTPRGAWGQCLEFAHAGLGSSGRAQRWRSLLLVADGGRSAQRITGYQAACSALCAGPDAGQVQLPAVQPVAAGQPALQLVWTRCGRAGCDTSRDARTVEGRADSDSGVLTLRP